MTSMATFVGYVDLKYEDEVVEIGLGTIVLAVIVVDVASGGFAFVEGVDSFVAEDVDPSVVGIASVELNAS